jgi:hypothetical protein
MYWNNILGPSGGRNAWFKRGASLTVVCPTITAEELEKFLFVVARK